MDKYAMTKYEIGLLEGGKFHLPAPTSFLLWMNSEFDVVLNSMTSFESWPSGNIFGIHKQRYATHMYEFMDSVAHKGLVSKDCDVEIHNIYSGKGPTMYDAIMDLSETLRAVVEKKIEEKKSGDFLVLFWRRPLWFVEDGEGCFCAKSRLAIHNGI
jgi:hypothetical protein